MWRLQAGSVSGRGRWYKVYEGRRLCDVGCVVVGVYTLDLGLQAGEQEGRGDGAPGLKMGMPVPSDEARNPMSFRRLPYRLTAR